MKWQEIFAIPGFGKELRKFVQATVRTSTDTKLDIAVTLGLGALATQSTVTLSQISDYVSDTTNPISTSDATPTTIKTFTVEIAEAGVVEVAIAGVISTGDAGITGKKIARYQKTTAGTLTLGAITDILTTEVDAALAGATWTIVASGGNVLAQVTGVAATNITWSSQWSRLRVNNAA